MDGELYVKMFDDIYSLVDKERLSEVLGEDKASRRQGLLLDVLREGVASSSLGSYGGEMWWYDGMSYIRVSEDELSNMVYDMLKEACVVGEDLLKVESFVRTLRRQVCVNELSVDNSKIGFSNCMLDLDTMEEISSSADSAVFNRFSFSYDPHAKCYLWHQFLDEVLPEESHQKILQEFCGCMFIDRKRVKIEKMLILKGSGANGKSVVFDVLCGLLGDGNVSHFTLKSLLDAGYERKRNISSINGKILNYASETDKFVIPAESGLLKALVSGEPLEARAMRGMNYIAKDIPLIMMNANVLPVIRDWSFGMRRRLIILPFSVEIPKWKQDPTLATRLKCELSGIMNWVLEGRRRFIDNMYKFTQSEIIEKLLEAYHGESSNVISFMQMMGYQRRSDVIKGAVPIWISGPELYSEYKKWCIASDDLAEGTIVFNKKLREGGWRIVRRSSGYFIALYGEKAIRRQTWLLMMDHAAHEMNVLSKGERYYNYRTVRRIAEKVMTANGWMRCAVGFTDLQEYLGYTFDYRSHIASGKMANCYVVSDGVYFFDLNSIDKLWRPQYEAKIKDRIRRKLEKEEYKKLMSGKDDGKERLS